MKDAELTKLGFLLIALILGISLSAFVDRALADNTSFKVQPQQEHVVTLSLQETDSVFGSFSVVSEDESGIDFHVIDPQNKTILRYMNAGQKSFSFTAEATGDYQLLFDNSVSSVYSKTIALNYNITHYIMGLPQEQFLLIVIAAVALIGIVVYAVLMPK